MPLKLAPGWGNRMVLQRHHPIPVRGNTHPHAPVTLRIESPTTATTLSQAHGTADAQGTFHFHLPPLDHDPAHHSLRVVVTSGDDYLTLDDVLVGDVWLCSGQSNMEWSVAESQNPETELADSDIPLLRLLLIPKAQANSPAENLEAFWQQANRESVAPFSAVAFFFARTLRRTLEGNVPIGLIGSYWGGTQAEAWTPLQALEAQGDALANLVTRYHTESAAPVEIQQPYVDTANLGEPAGWHLPDHDTSDWGTMPMPQTWQALGLAHNGSVWFRREITLGEDVAHPATLSIGICDDMDHTYVNGHLVGRTGSETPNFWSVSRQYAVPAGVLRPGRNVIAVRVFDQWGAGGILGPAANMHLDLHAPQPSSHELAGKWTYKVETALPLRSPPQGQPIAPTTLYNAMIHPLVPMPIRGALWYQGESNADRGEQYRTLLPTMISAWRDRFGLHFPFYIVQLANWRPRESHPADSDWAELREAQDSAQLALRDVYMISAIDVGDDIDIHPRDKQTVGRRLADAALATTYGHDIPWRHPSLDRATFRGNHVEIHLKDAAGLHVRGDRIEGFALAGEDRQWQWANAELQGDHILLHCDRVPSPVAVRYAWMVNPPSTLFNARGLPVLPFRTDTWPGVSTGRR